MNWLQQLRDTIDHTRKTGKTHPCTGCKHRHTCRDLDCAAVQALKREAQQK